MAYLQWDSAYDTGIDAIDYEHRTLVSLLNQVDVLIATGAPHAAVSELLGEFHALASAHLALEEKILRDIDHPALQLRRHHHNLVLEQVREIMDAYERGDYAEDGGLPTALRDWLSDLLAMDSDMFTRMEETRLKHWGLTRV